MKELFKIYSVYEIVHPCRGGLNIPVYSSPECFISPWKGFVSCNGLISLCKLTMIAMGLAKGPSCALEGKSQNLPPFLDAMKMYCTKSHSRSRNGVNSVGTDALALAIAPRGTSC